MSLFLTSSEKKLVTLCLVSCAVGLGVHLLLGGTGMRQEEINPEDRLAAQGETVATAAPAEQGRIDLNRSTVDELCELPGIGPRLAERIVAYREKNGPYTHPGELVHVERIGPKTLRRLEGLIYCSECEEERGEK